MPRPAEKRTVDMQVIGDWVEPGARVLDLGCNVAAERFAAEAEQARADVVGASSLLQSQISTMKGDWYDKVEVSIFLCNDNSEAASCSGGKVTDAQREQIKADLKIPQDKLPTFISAVSQ